MSTPPTDDDGRFVWVVTWGRPGRRDWTAVLVKAYDADEALAIARAANPDLLPPDNAVLAAPATAQSVIEGRPVAFLPVIP